MRLMGPVALLVLTTAFVAPPARAASPAPVAGARLVTLKNGMRLLLAPDSTATAVDVAVWFQAGPLHEKPGLTGVSHLLEHLMFRGSEHYGPQEHSRLVQGEGGAANAYTVPDYACFYETVPPAALDLALQLEADRIGALRLTTDGLEAEKRVLREERRWGAAAGPRAVVLERLCALAWTRHPYGRPVIGLPEDLDRISLADCEAYYRSHYGPNNALVTIVGAFDPQGALQAATRWLQPLRRREVPGDAAAPEPAQREARRVSAHAGVPVPMLAVGWKIAGRPDPDAPALRLLAHVLGDGPSSRLQRALVQGPTQCLSAECSLDARREAGLFYALVAARPDVDSTSVESTLVAETARLAREPVSDEELDRARRQERIGQLFAWQTARGLAESLGSAQLEDGDFHAAGDALEALSRVTPADLQRVAARVLTDAGRCVVWLHPADGTAAPVEGGGGGSGAGRPAAEGGR